MNKQKREMEAPVLIIGIGNDYRGDDAVGLAVVRALQTSKITHARLMESDGDCTTLLESWKGAAKVILIDALVSGTRAGTIRRFDIRTQSIPAECTFSSTHAFGIAETLALARTLSQLPPCLILYGIEGTDFTAGSTLSPPVKSAVRKAMTLVLDDIL